ncbi:uncharacterized protein LOC142317751 [Lycorma delicatula]|uniref:uncharacterized protein LOC142317751 n=1 Tax=Lycorma delicatula TaxID=130591 RepID=UPI003F513540
MSTRAIHLELVQELTTKSFLAALSRFTSRRGNCIQIFSDNAKNFIGARNKLRDIYVLLSSKDHQDTVAQSASKNNIQWNFIPPRSPHFGGLWEAGVKSVKHHLVRVVGKTNLTYEELSTVLCKIEGCLNSRPLTPLSSDPSDRNPLTPGHFLIGEPLQAVPEKDVSQLNVHRLDRWQRICQLTQHFWQRWQQEFMSELQARVKWRKTSQNVKPGMLVHTFHLPTLLSSSPSPPPPPPPSSPPSPSLKNKNKSSLDLQSKLFTVNVNCLIQ